MDADFFMKLRENIPPQFKTFFDEELTKRRGQIELQNKIPSIEEYNAASQAKAAQEEPLPEFQWEDQRPIDWESIEDTDEVIVPEVMTTGGDAGGMNGDENIDWERIAREDDPNIIIPETRISSDTINGGGYLREKGSTFVPNPASLPTDEVPVKNPSLGDLLNLGSINRAQQSSPMGMEPDIFPETQELMDINKQYQDILANEEGALNFAKSGRPIAQTPQDVDVSDLTPADYEAGRQLLRGETPTANLKIAQNRVNAARYRDMGGAL